MLLKTLICAASLAVVGVAYAEETTVIKRESEPVVRVETAPVAVERRTSVTTGCETKVIRKENDLGDSKTIQKTDC